MGLMTNPVCGACVHFRREETSGGDDETDTPMKQICDAYPAGIPQDDAFQERLWTSKHATPLPGDRGVHFAPAPPRRQMDAGE
jgi:hypothetical protein